jgi:hypothetical protein
VKFRNIDEGVLKAIQMGEQRSLEDGATSDDEDESESGSDDENEKGTNLPVPPPPEAFSFEVDSDVDIDSVGLRDKVAIESVVREEVQPPQRPLKPPQHATPNWNW